MKRLLTSSLFILLLSVTLQAQVLSLNVSDQPLRDVLPQVEQQCDWHFFYNSSLPGLDSRVTVNLTNVQLEQALKQLFAGTGIVYKLTDNKVIVLTAEEKKSATRQVSGTVIDKATNEPIIGASVIIKGTTQGTITDYEGQFVLDASTGQYIEISYLGYEPYDLRVNANADNYRVALTESTSQLDEVVVVGYGAQKKVNLTGAVSVVDQKEIVGRPTPNMAVALQGVDPALNVTMSAGGPGASYNFNIRGSASINNASTTKPLVLVDGVEMDLSRINSNDIESVSILKDASASAIYGSKAAAGVILVTTKSGKEGLAPQVTIDTKAGFKTETTEHDFITQGYWSAYISDIFMRQHTNYAMTTYTDADYAELWMRINDKTENPERPWVVTQPDGSYKYYANFNWYDYYYKSTRPVQDYNISLKGGNERVNYFVSARYFTEDGMIRIDNDKWHQVSTRAKVNINIKPWMHYGVNFSFFSSRYTYPGTTSSRELFRVGSLHAMAYIPATNPDGSAVYLNPWIYSGQGTVGDGMNALLIYGKHKNTNINREMVMQHSLSFDLYKNLSLNADYSLTWRMKEISNRSVKVPYSCKEGTTDVIENFRSVDSYHQQLARYITHNYNVYLRWTPTWGKHSLTLTAGYNGEMYRYHSLEAERMDLMTEDLSSFNFAKGEVTDLSESIKTASTNGFFARVNYDWAGRYLFEVSVRADASSRFAPVYRWAVAPGGSIGWRMSEEPFWEPIQGWWSNAKIRLSAGQLANQMTGYYDYIQSVDADGMFTQSITLDGQSVLSYATEADPNAGTLTWEKMTTYDAGLDLSWLNNRLSLTGDIYMRNTEGMLNTGTALPSVYGATDPKRNSANMSTKGWELSLVWRDQQKVAGKPFRYEIGGGVGNYKTIITKYNNPEKLLSTYYEGQVLGEIWGYEIDGLFANRQEVDDYMTKVNPVESEVYTDIMAVMDSEAPGLHPGDVRYVDLNGDGKITSGNGTVDNPGDRRVIGNRLPKYNYNFHVSADWYGIDLSIYFQGVGHCDWYPLNEATTYWGPYSRPYQGFMAQDFMTRVWSEDNPNAYFPRYRAYEALGSANSLGPTNNRYMLNVGYLRLKNITLGYTLPCWKKVFSEFRIYFSAENPWYWSPLQQYCRSIDPEQAIAGSQAITYGFARSFTFGLTATF
ncbi:MAG: TonB-dependent receptor [Paludibacteraceae bacterium]|nr:TonB-dependent receptor [Paludibacteraceae bacterium]